MRDKKILLAFACVLACLTGGGAIATAGDDTDPAPVPEAQAADAQPVDSIQPEQAAELQPLREERTEEDALPDLAHDALVDDENADEHFGANPSLSRHTAPGVWIVPADGYVCLASSAPGESAIGFGCATPDDVERGLLAPSDVDENGNGVLTGVLPDGVAEVRLVDNDGSERTVPVDNNTYRAAIDANLKEVRFTDADGGSHVLPMGWHDQ